MVVGAVAIAGTITALVRWARGRSRRDDGAGGADAEAGGGLAVPAPPPPPTPTTSQQLRSSLQDTLLPEAAPAHGPDAAAEAAAVDPAIAALRRGNRVDKEGGVELSMMRRDE